MSDCAEVGNYQFCIIKDCLVGDLMMSRKVLMDKRFLDQETFFDDQNTETRILSTTTINLIIPSHIMKLYISCDSE